MSVYKAQYIWIDGGRPTAKMRTKTKILETGEEPGIWGFDGSSTQQAPGEASDCVLQPVQTYPDPVRGGDNVLVMCEVLNTDMTAHVSNTRAKCRATMDKFAHHKTLFGLEQEYTFFDGNIPLGWPVNGFPAPQGGYYCGVGADEVFGREIVEEHLDACLAAGIKISGINAEVMPAQWEFQVGPVGGIDAADQLWLARYLLYRIAENFGVSATLHPKPIKGDWNGAGCHCNFSTESMRQSYAPIIRACEALGEKASLHIKHYGEHIEQRLTGEHETCSWKEFKYGVSDRGASVRIPWQVEQDQKGYIEDRRPNGNCDPYDVTRLIVDTVCSAFDKEEKG